MIQTILSLLIILAGIVSGLLIVGSILLSPVWLYKGLFKKDWELGKKSLLVFVTGWVGVFVVGIVWMVAEFVGFMV